MGYLALGERIRRIRESQKLSLEDVAKRTGIAEARLRAIESDEEQPIIAHLIQLSKVFGVNVAEMFRDRPTRVSYEIVRKSEREKRKPLRKIPDEDSARIFDYSYEVLSLPSDDKHLEAFLIEVPPHQSKRPSDDVTHAGEEFMYVLAGVIHGEIDGKAVALSEGDAIYFRSTTRHVFFNPSDQISRALVVIYPF